MQKEHKKKMNLRKILTLSLILIALLAPTAMSVAQDGLSGSISEAGSTTVQPLAEELAAAFMSLHPDVEIDVQGGGSSAGVKGAGEGAVDVGGASREIKDSELGDFPDLQVFTIAYDGIAFVSHPDVPVDDITLEQGQQIFAGEVTNWSELGGPDEPIVVVSREEGSGTRGAFEDIVMGDYLITEDAIFQPSNGSVRTIVSTTPYAIGYLSFGYLDETTKPMMVNGVAPSTDNVVAGTYPVFRPLNLVTNGEPNELVQAWLDFILAQEGQAIVAADYISVIPPVEWEGEISEAGSTTVQPLAESLAAAFNETYPNITIDVQGGGSSSGVKGAGEGAVDVGAASREIKDSEFIEFESCPLTVYTIALDGIAFVVHNDVPVDDITLEQGQQIFAGELTNWSELGGPDEPIVVVSREEGSGTRGAFEDIVMGDALITADAILQQSNGGVRTVVSETPFSIGYLSFGYLDESTKTLMVDGTEATTENVVSGEYPVSRPLNLVTCGEPMGVVKLWLDWSLSSEGQAIVAEDYISVAE
jgi:phosphate transport system substrate-binding protein